MAKKDDDFPLNLDSLSDEEREIYENAIAEATAEKDTADKADSDLGEEIAAEAAPKAQEEDDDDEDDDAASEPDAGADADAGSDAGAEPEPATAEADDDIEDDAQAPQPEVVAFGDDEQARLAAIEGDKDQLLDQFDEGELTREAYREKLKALEAEERDLEKKQAEAEASKKAQDDWLAGETAKWEKSCAAFWKDHPEMVALGAKDATEEQRQVLASFDEAVKFFASTATDDVSNRAILNKALAAVHVQYPDMPKPKLPKPKAKEKTIEAKKTPRPAPPPRLANVPAADVTDVDGSAFGKLNELAATDGSRFERILANMTDEQREAYAKAS